jgi:hypothetical protein
MPAGLALNPGSGVISGTPTVASPQTSYKVVAANASGSTSTTVDIAVSQASIAYPGAYLGFTAGVAAQTLTPTVNGTTFTAWTVNPPLPTGLSLNTTTGSISGQPTAAAPPANYVVTATNTAGAHESATLTIAVVGAPLLDLGLAFQVELMRYVNTSVLSQDRSGRWILQDFTSGATLASGGGGTATLLGAPAPYIDLQGGVMVDDEAAELEIRSATSGQVLSTIPHPAQVSWFRLATDGSYVVAGSSTALTAWSTSGQVLISLTGNYSQAAPFAAPGQIQIALGPAGQSVIQTITVPGGTSSVSPAFLGVFNTWFADGQRFLTSQGTTVWTYSNTAAKQDLTSVTKVVGLAGEGNWFWTFDSTLYGVLNVYRVGSSATPAFTTGYGTDALAVGSGQTIGALAYGVGQLSVIDLSGATPVSTSYNNVPYGYLNNYAAQSATQWLVGNSYGVVFDGASLGGKPRSLTLGTALAVAAGSTYISVATASGKMLYFNASDDSQAGTIDFAASQLSASADGTVLAARATDVYNQYFPDRTVNVYSLPSGTVSSSFAYSYPNTTLTHMAMSPSATTLAEVFGLTPTTGCVAQVIAVNGGGTVLCDNSGNNIVQLSPDGTLAATSPAATPTSPSVTSEIYQNGTLLTAVPGQAVGWLDNSQLLLNNYTSHDLGLIPTGTTIYNSAGTMVGTTPLPTMSPFQVVSAAANTVYDTATNTIVSLASGNTLWASGNLFGPTYYGTAGAVTGSQVIFVSDNLVLAQPH